MNSTIRTIFCRIVTVVCTLGVLCQCGTVVEGPIPTTDPRRFNEGELAMNAKKLKRGDSMQQCVSLLGEPNLRQVYQRWPQNGEYAGARFYYVVRQEGVHLMPETDRHLRVYFDAKDQVKRIEWLGVSSP